MRSWLPLLLVALTTPLPAEALTVHRPFGSVGLEASYDDHISGRSAPEIELYPSGNTDWRGALSLGAGTDVSFDETWGLYLGGRLRAFRYLNYADFSGVVGSGTAELSGYGLPMGLDAFLSYGYSTDGSQGGSHTLALSVEHPVLNWLSLLMGGGHFWHRTATDGLDNRGPFADAGLQLSFSTKTSLSAIVSYLGRGYDYGRSDQVLSASVSVSQRLMPGTYLRATFRHDRTTSNEPGRSFPGNAASMGTSYYF